MSKNYTQLFSHLEALEPTDDLLGKVLSRLDKERFIVIRRRIALLSGFLVVLVLALVPAFKMVWDGINASGFTQFLSLLFSDSGVVMAYWQSFGLTLLESLPVISIVVFLAIVVSFLGSARLLSKNLKIIHNLKLI